MSKIKICGLTRDCDIDFVNEALPDYIGFVFAKSKRQVSPQRAGQLCKRLNSKIIPVGVFVNDSIDTIKALYESGIIHLIQLHGDEDPQYIEKLRSKLSAPIIKAFQINESFDPSILSTFPADYFLFDQGKGGTGKTFNWNLLPDTKKPFFLAGGLCRANIKTAIQYSPFAVDVSSGVETDGKKDRQKILDIISAVRSMETACIK